MFSARPIRKFACAIALVAAGCLFSAGAAPGLFAQDAKPAAKKAETKRAKAVVRLPNHFAKVVTQSQRNEIYAIQKDYAPRIKELEDALAALVAERDAKIRGVLSAEQQKELDEYVAAAKAKRAKARQERAATNEKSAPGGE